MSCPECDGAAGHDCEERARRLAEARKKDAIRRALATEMFVVDALGKKRTP